MSDFPNLAALSTDLAAAVAHAGKSVVAIHARRRIPSSGVLWRDGFVVAAHHTIRRDDGITVTLADGRSVAAKLRGRDPGTDLAVLELAEAVPAPAPLAGDDALAVGQLVLAVGRPGKNATAALGIVAEVGGEWRTWPGGRIDRFVRSDVSVQDGFSGSALVDSTGRITGVNTSGLARAAAITVPATTVHRVAEQLLERGHVERGWLGCALQPVRVAPRVVEALSLGDAAGLLVVGVEPKGPADAAGLLVGDVLLSLGGTTVRDPMDVLSLLNASTAGAEVVAKIARGESALDITVTLGARPRREHGRR